MQLQGGGGSRRGASASDDNAADVRTRPREPGLIRTTDPSGRCARRCPLPRSFLARTQLWCRQ
ncbi:hypothetical protein CP981_33730 [Streptomyces platensis]|uniref:Uncharacterized protein n=1 Tax=Streptomyces platensis TaxID=58346 RepID=A0AAE6TQ79_STRPT|nr:hypothetical protein CP981_33730 [Streptomyces platensis]